MKLGARWVIQSVVLGAFVVLAAPGCGSDEEEEDTGEQKTGIACAKNKDCGPLGWCMTAETVKDVSDGTIVVEPEDIPDGYCSQLSCRKGEGENVCGTGGYCFDLRQYLPDNPIGLCGQTCQSDSDCRTGFVCHDGALTYQGVEVFKPLPFKACLPPVLLCLLDIAQPECPDVVPPIDAGAPPDDGGSSNPDAG